MVIGVEDEDVFVFLIFKTASFGHVKVENNEGRRYVASQSTLCFEKSLCAVALLSTTETRITKVDLCAFRTLRQPCAQISMKSYIFIICICYRELFSIRASRDSGAKTLRFQLIAARRTNI
jgi:hypothetical protein